MPDGDHGPRARFHTMVDGTKEDWSIINDAMKPFVEPLNVSLGHLQQATMWFMNNAMKNPDNAGAGATDYMHMFGLVALGLMWGKIALAVNEKLAAGDAANADALKNKLIVGRFFAEKMINGRKASADGPIKTFPLRGIKDSPPYLHDDRLLTLEDTVEFFNLVLGTKLTADEKKDLTAFLRVL